MIFKSRGRLIEKILLIALFCSSIAVVVAAVAQGLTAYYSVRIPGRGMIRGIGIDIYWDAACTNSCVEINWGEMNPGQSKDTVLYVKNIRRVPVELALLTGAWDPDLAKFYISLSWNYTGQTLRARDVLPVKFTLTVSPKIFGVETFSFDIVIQASSVES